MIKKTTLYILIRLWKWRHSLFIKECSWALTMVIHIRVHFRRSYPTCNVIDWLVNSIEDYRNPEPSDSFWMLYDLSYRGDISYRMFWNIGSGGIDILICKVDIWNVNWCTNKNNQFRLTNGCFENVYSEKMSRPKGTWPPNFRFMPIALPFELPRPGIKADWLSWF